MGDVLRMNVIRRRYIEQITERRLEFRYLNDPNSGFTFACDEAGNVNEKLSPAARQNYLDCVNGVHDVGKGFIQCTMRTVVHPTIIECYCGNELALSSSWANVCSCGIEFNGSGQELAPREQWGEETGEQFV